MSILLTLNLPLIIIAALTILGSVYLIKRYGRPWDVPGLWLSGGLYLANIGLVMAIILDVLNVNSRLFYMFGLSGHLTALAYTLVGFILVACTLKLITNVFNRGYSQLLAKLQFWLCFVGVNMYAANRYHRLISDQPYGLRKSWQELDIGNYLYVLGRTSVFLSFAIFAFLIVGAIAKNQPVKKKPVDAKVAVFE